MLPQSLILWLFFVVASVSADAPNCGQGCHALALCVGNSAASSCECQAGTIDTSAGQDGTACTINAFRVRFVGAFSLPSGISDPSEVVTLSNSAALSFYCPNDPEIKGYYVRPLSLRHNPSSGSAVTEVNCLYEERPANISASYVAHLQGLGTVSTAPAIDRWVLPTTSAPMEIPPTGLAVNTVHFEPTCADSGCWVVRGTLTTGEAFNSFDVFNTFFLPQADITAEHPQGDLSYDYDYSAVEWTFSPANHPCTSAGFKADAVVPAGTDRLQKVSTCCIHDAGPSAPGFVPHYRPTETFVRWANHLECDARFTRVGEERCWRVYEQDAMWSVGDMRCKAAGGKLATVRTAEENAQLRTLLDERHIRQAWLGLKDEFEHDDSPRYYSESDVPDNVAYDGQLEGEVRYESDWRWRDGSNASFDAWAAAQPHGQDCDAGEQFNYSYFDGFVVGRNYWCTERDYAFMQADGSWATTNNVGFPLYGMPFVCEFEPPSECITHVVQRPNFAAPEKEADRCLEAHPRWETWGAAQGICASKGGSLVTLDDVEEHYFLRRVLEHANIDIAWMGLSDNETEGDWVWLDGGDLSDEMFWYEYDYYSYHFRYSYYVPESPYESYFVFDYYDQYESESFHDENDCAIFMKSTAWWMPQPCDNLAMFVCDVPRANATRCDSDEIVNEDDPWDIPFPMAYQQFLTGKFKGLNASPGVSSLVNTDPFFGQWAFEIKLDEVELRSRAGILRGTVGVEHTVDTFLGLANFRPTGTRALDTFATQQNLHLEKTSFFAVATHGENDHTFLEYVNMRLVSVYREDADFTGSNDERSERTSPAGSADFVQVTFTLGEQYRVSNNPSAGPLSGGLIPLDSVTAGRGSFLDEVEAAGGMQQVCSDYYGALAGGDVGLAEGSSVTRADFDAVVAQACGPQAAMCASPAAVPDHFAAFNVPLGSEVFAGQADNSLASNVFVSMVVSALDASAGAGAASQMKTTLTASIPIVAGGVNVFCDGVTAKTDLKDVADVDIVLGTARDGSELAQLRTAADVASTELTPTTPEVMDSASIEAALMTLVLKGEHSYFRDVNSNTGDYALELEDVITLHLMEGGQATATNSKEAAVVALLAAPSDDNSDTNGLDTDGYNLNGAFKFTIDRASGTASLEPREALLAECPFNPPRPAVDNVPLETCILRRDVQRRAFPARQGGERTAMEILAASLPRESTEAAVDARALALGSDSAEAAFLASVLGDSDLAKALAADHARAIHEQYRLNGRYRRAFWVNPGYEWTPTQTQGRSIFSVSQKLYLFALISLDENWSLRRMLLQSNSGALQDASAGLGQEVFAFPVSPKSMMATTFNVPEQLVALFSVELQLSQATACADPTVRQSTVRSILAGYVDDASSPIHTLIVTRMSLDLNGLQCPASRRSIRRSLLAESFSAATSTVEMMVVYKEETRPTFNQVAFAAMPGVNYVAADDSNSNAISISTRPWEPMPDDDEGGGVNVPLVAGIAGGAGGLLLIAGGLYWWKRRESEMEIEPTFCSIADLKVQLQQEL